VELHPQSAVCEGISTGVIPVALEESELWPLLEAVCGKHALAASSASPDLLYSGNTPGW
jgi:hypothetical protein